MPIFDQTFGPTGYNSLTVTTPVTTTAGYYVLGDPYRWFATGSWSNAVTYTWGAPVQGVETPPRGQNYAQPIPPAPDHDVHAGIARPSLAVARSRAQETLLALLTEREREVYRRTGVIHVRGSEGNEYEIHRGHARNIRRGRGRYCAHPPAFERVDGRTLAIPEEDSMIAQMLMISTDEKEFLRIANVDRW